MFLTLSTTRPPATDLGYLLAKNPGRAQSFDVSTGTAHVFYPEATDERCTVALLLGVDPIGLVRGSRLKASEGFALGQYVNDRPYAGSSLLAVALSRVFRSAMRGDCKERPDLPSVPLPLEVRIPVLPCRGGTEMAEKMFAPLGWEVAASAIPLDETMPSWGDSRYVDLTLRGELVLAEALRQLYVLLPVLDDGKHYWVTTDEIDKLVRAGEGWLNEHPERETITRRYLAHQRPLAGAALARLAEADDTPEELMDDADAAPATERSLSLAEQRKAAVLATLHDVGAKRVLDLGCGDGKLLRALLDDHSFTEIVGCDVSMRVLGDASRRLHLDTLAPMPAARIRLLQSSLTYTDDRLLGYDAAVLMEVIEHLDAVRLEALQHNIFAYLRPTSVIVTTPNVEFNVLYEGLEPGRMRHRDHRFEWTRQEFATWAEAVAASSGYTVSYKPVGDEDPDLGPSTQMAVFRR